MIGPGLIAMAVMDQIKMNKHYAPRDTEALAPYFYNHLVAMTNEQLHSKAAIAAELAHRDAEIDRLTNENTELRKDHDRIQRVQESLLTVHATLGGHFMSCFDDDKLGRVYFQDTSWRNLIDKMDTYAKTELVH